MLMSFWRFTLRPSWTQVSMRSPAESTLFKIRRKRLFSRFLVASSVLRSAANDATTEATHSTRASHSTCRYLKAKNVLSAMLWNSTSRLTNCAKTTSTSAPFASHCKTRQKDYRSIMRPEYLLSPSKDSTFSEGKSLSASSTHLPSTWKATLMAISTLKAKNQTLERRNQL